MTSHFVYQLPVRFADTDAQGHVFFANYLTFCDEALSAYMRAIGCPWQTLVDAGVDMVYAKASCEFRGSATFETMLAVAVRIARFGHSSINSEFAIRIPDRNDPIAIAQLTSVCVDTKNHKPVRVPDMLRDAVRRHQDQAEIHPQV